MPTQAGTTIFTRLVGGILTSLAISGQAIAQVNPDNTLSTTVSTFDNLNFIVENGTQAGQNLFHSFEKFSVPTGGSVFFKHLPDIAAVFSRVTGRDPSQIDGELQTNGGADLFLLNPNGILFGPNARLNLGGSFIASTANSVLFADGIAFPTTAAPPASPLSITTPIGLQLGRRSGDIQIQGTGHTMTYPQNIAIPFDRSLSSRGLVVPTGHSLLLIGQNIRLNSGVLTAEEGHIGLGAIAPNPSNGPLSTTDVQVTLTSDSGHWRFTDAGNELGRIELSERSLIDASGGSFSSGSGSIHLQASQVELNNASTLLLQNIGLQKSGEITVNATDSLSLGGNSPIGPTISEIRAESLGPGAGGNITVTTNRLKLQDGAQVATGTFSAAPGGNLTIEASERSSVKGPAQQNQGALPSSSFVGSASLGQGSAGNLNFSTGQLMLSDGGFVASTTLAQGNGGNVLINATESITVSDINPLTLGASSINVATLGNGDAGTLTINAPTIQLVNGGEISSSTLANGNAGELSVNAAESLRVEGQAIVGAVVIRSEITSGSERIELPEANRIALGIPQVPSGESGSLLIQTPILVVNRGGSISVRNDGVSSDAGNLDIRANHITLDEGSRVTATTLEGQGGDIRIGTDTLRLWEHSQINASTQSGTAGNIELQVRQDLALQRGGQILAEATQAGQGGSINIDALNTTVAQDSSISTNVEGNAFGGSLRFVGDRLSISGGSSIATATQGSGQAGNAFIQVKEIDVVGIAETSVVDIGITPTPSLIVAGSLPSSSGKGGNLRIDSDRIRVLDGGLITAGTLGSGDSGELEINASQSLEVSGIGNLPAPLFGWSTSHPSRISASSLGTAAAGSVQIQTPFLSIANQGVVEVNGAGSGGAGNLKILSDRTVLNNRASLQAQVAGGNQGNIQLIATEGAVLSERSNITTNASNSASGGNINIDTPFLIGLDNSDIVANAVAGNGGMISIATKRLLGLEFRAQQTDQNDITASSEFGLSGTVAIQNFSLSQTGTLNFSAPGIKQTEQEVTASCVDRKESGFIVVGRGGLPIKPTQAIPVHSLWRDERSQATMKAASLETSRLHHQSTITEAAMVRTDGNNQVHLLASRANRPNQNTQLLSCRHLQKQAPIT